MPKADLFDGEPLSRRTLTRTKALGLARNSRPRSSRRKLGTSRRNIGAPLSGEILEVDYVSQIREAHRVSIVVNVIQIEPIATVR